MSELFTGKTSRSAQVPTLSSWYYWKQTIPNTKVLSMKKFNQAEQRADKLGKNRRKIPPSSRSSALLEQWKLTASRSSCGSKFARPRRCVTMTTEKWRHSCTEPRQFCKKTLEQLSGWTDFKLERTIQTLFFWKPISTSKWHLTLSCDPSNFHLDSPLKCVEFS